MLKTGGEKAGEKINTLNDTSVMDSDTPTLNSLIMVDNSANSSIDSSVPKNLDGTVNIAQSSSPSIPEQPVVINELNAGPSIPEEPVAINELKTGSSTKEHSIVTNDLITTNSTPVSELIALNLDDQPSEPVLELVDDGSDSDDNGFGPDFS